MPAADICFAFLGSGQSLPGVAEWHSLLPICTHHNRSSRGQLAVLCAGVSSRVFEPAHQHGSCAVGSTTLHVPGAAHPALLPGRTQSAPMLSLLPRTSNRKLLRTLHPPILGAAGKQLSSFVSNDATELSVEELHPSMAIFLVLLGWSDVYHTLGTVS